MNLEVVQSVVIVFLLIQNAFQRTAIRDMSKMIGSINRTIGIMLYGAAEEGMDTSGKPRS